MQVNLAMTLIQYISIALYLDLVFMIFAYDMVLISGQSTGWMVVR